MYEAGLKLKNLKYRFNLASVIKTNLSQILIKILSTGSDFKNDSLQ